MSKKKNKKKNKHRLCTKGWHNIEEEKSKKEKKREKKLAMQRNSSYPSMRRIKLSLDTKDIKKNKKIINQPIEVPKEFKNNRSRCNHADGMISVEEFKQLTPAFAVFTPQLNRVCRMYGEENVSICKACYDTIVDVDLLDVEQIDKAMAILYTAANCVLSGNRLKTEEIQEINRLKNSLHKWEAMIPLLTKAKERNISFDEAVSKQGRYASLNDVTGIG